MALSEDLVSKVIKTMNANSRSKQTSSNVLYGKAVVQDGVTYVQLDGSDAITPVVSTSDAKDGERVTVQINNRTASIVGNVDSPAARVADVQDVSQKVLYIDTLEAYEVTTRDLEAVNAAIDNLEASIVDTEALSALQADINTLRAKFADVDRLTVDDLEAINADINNIEAKAASIDTLDAETLSAITANIGSLSAQTAVFKYAHIDAISALKASIDDLDVDKLSAKDAELKYVNVDFANITKVQMEEFYAKSGLIQYVTSEDATVTGRLVGVTISGDLIEGNTVKADKLVVLGEDGIYYKLNFECGTFTDAEEIPTDSLHGSVITANTITADKISVSDLVAFDATIGGFHITDKALYSGVKETVDNDTRGTYLDNEGQLAIGDSTHYIKYYKSPVVDDSGEPILDENGEQAYEYKLAISAESVLFDSGSKNVGEALSALTEKIKIGSYEDVDAGNTKPCIELSEGDTDFKQILTNAEAMFLNGDVVGTKVDHEGLTATNVRVEEEFRLGKFVWSVRENGNCGILWKG